MFRTRTSEENKILILNFNTGVAYSENIPNRSLTIYMYTHIYIHTHIFALILMPLKLYSNSLFLSFLTI